MEVIIIIIGVILLILGLAGCILPVLPGPVLAYLALVMLMFLPEEPFTINFLIIWALVTALVTLLDYVVPIYGTKKLGGSRSGINGSVIGVVVGFIFLGPLGLIIGPLIGAYLGELIAGKQNRVALRSAFGSFLGFLAGTFIKIIVVLIMTYHFIDGVIS
ncbi:MAG: DUF456 domain-containing protein [Bacteroidales bacterium]